MPDQEFDQVHDERRQPLAGIRAADGVERLGGPDARGGLRDARMSRAGGGQLRAGLWRGPMERGGGRVCGRRRRAQSRRESGQSIEAGRPG